MTVPTQLLAGGMVLGAAGLCVSVWRAPARGRPRTRRLESSHGATERVPRPTSTARSRAASHRGMVLAVVSGVGVGALTRWPVAALLAAASGLGLPRLLGSLRAQRTTERIEAVATWTELLRDTLAAAAGLSQAITATAELAPQAIRVPVLVLAERLASGVSMEGALRSFADDLADPSADLVVCALLVAATARSQRLGDLLGALAQSCREEVAMRLRVESSRASSRSSVRTVILFSVSFAALLFVAARSYLAPFGTATGQFILLVVGACYVAGLTFMVRLVRPRPAARLLPAEHGS